MKIENRYLDGTYFKKNPNWDRDDAIWKANLVTEILNKHNLIPKSIVEVGCGSGDILRYLCASFKDIKMTGYDISPQAQGFWQEDNDGIDFVLGDFHLENYSKFDVLMMLDVFEHVRDPYSFLENSKKHADYFVFHIPLDLSAQSVLRKSPLIAVRRSVGHLHSYTKDLALETLIDSGYEIIECDYTGAGFNTLNQTIKTKLARIPRWLLRLINRDFAVRLFGGETLVVLAR